jgi:4-hydroxy-2-oxoheptanedioate aldolase
VRALVERAIRDIGGAGKAPGVFCADEALARHYLALGARFIAVGADSSVLAAATAALARRFKSGAEATPARDAY